MVEGQIAATSSLQSKSAHAAYSCYLYNVRSFHLHSCTLDLPAHLAPLLDLPFEGEV